jgi:predicted nuclease of predicted toxin-antitoxin system
MAMIRFHLDEHVDPAIAAGLRQRGIDVTTTTDAGLASAPDEDHLRFALAEGRVIFTNDRHFLVHHARGIPHAGIAYVHQNTRTIGETVRYLALMADCLDAAEMAGQVEFL